MTTDCDWYYRIQKKNFMKFYWSAVFTQVVVLSVGSVQKEYVSEWKKNYSMLKQYINITQIWK